MLMLTAELAFSGFYLSRQDYAQLPYAEYLSVRHIQRAYALPVVVVERVDSYVPLGVGVRI